MELATVVKTHTTANKMPVGDISVHFYNTLSDKETCY